jgi:proteasome accessory factor A
MDKRIFGIETEYGVTCTLRGQRRLSPDEVARYLFRKVVSWGRSSNVFLENGARLYLDVGSHPEYATPECDSIYDCTVHDKAGERKLEELLIGAEQRLKDEGIRGTIYLFKNNTDSAGNSYGCHENYLTRRSAETDKYQQHLIPFLISRQIYTGAGQVLQTARGPIFSIAQRAEHIWESMSSATTRSRPIINTRDEPHADPDELRRLHIIVGDSNMSETTTILKVATAELMLRASEQGLLKENPITEQLAAISVGINKNGKIIADLNYEEDSSCETDMNIVMTRSLKFVEVQGTAEKNPFSSDQLSALLDCAKACLQEVFKKQDEALL